MNQNQQDNPSAPRPAIPFLAFGIAIGVAIGASFGAEGLAWGLGLGSFFSLLTQALVNRRAAQHPPNDAPKA